MDFFRKTYQDNQDFVDPPVHDPCTVAYLIDPSTVHDDDVAARSTSSFTGTNSRTGMTVADLRGPEPSAEQCHTQVAVKTRL